MLHLREQSYPSDHAVFVDTSAIAAIMNEADPFHKEAQEHYAKMGADGYSLLLTNFVIAETHALLLKNTHSIPIGLQWLDAVAYKAFHVVRPSEEDETQAIQLLKNYQDKGWSFTDAVSFQVMQRLDITYYFSFDDDFRQIGKFLDITHYLRTP